MRQRTLGDCGATQIMTTWTVVHYREDDVAVRSPPASRATGVFRLEETRDSSFGQTGVKAALWGGPE